MCETRCVCAGGVSTRMCVCVCLYTVVNYDIFFFSSLQNGRAAAAALIRELYMWQRNGVAVYVQDGLRDGMCKVVA